MIQDRFEIQRRGKNFYLLRILNKVDFSEEVVWARGYQIDQQSDYVKICSRLLDYLAEGFDIIREWPQDEEGWHLSVGHMGFNVVAETQNLVYLYLTSKPGSEDNKAIDPLIANKVCTLNENKDRLKDKLIPSYTGSIYEALQSKKYTSFKPKDPKSLVNVPFEWIFTEDYDSLNNLLEDYS